jgi:hypothetical protein
VPRDRPEVANLDDRSRAGLAASLVTLGEVQRQAGFPAAACQAFRRAENVIGHIEPTHDLSSDTDRTVALNLADARRDLASCGPPAPK